MRLSQDNLPCEVAAALWSLPRDEELGTKRKNLSTCNSDDVSIWTDDVRSSSVRSTTFSFCTSFEENESPSLTRVTPSASPSGAQLSRNLRIDTTTPLRSSKGWWNYILSPFISTSDLLVTHDKDSCKSSPNHSPGSTAERRGLGISEMDTWKNPIYRFDSEKPQSSNSHIEWYLDSNVKNVSGKVPLIQRTRRSHLTASIEASICGFSEAGSVHTKNLFGDQQAVSSDGDQMQTETATTSRPEQNTERMTEMNNSGANIKNYQPESPWKFKKVVKKKPLRSSNKPMLENQFPSNPSHPPTCKFSYQKELPYYSGYYTKTALSAEPKLKSQSRKLQISKISLKETPCISRLPFTRPEQRVADQYSRYLEPPYLSSGGNFLRNLPRDTNLPVINQQRSKRRKKILFQPNNNFGSRDCIPKCGYSLLGVTKIRKRWKFYSTVVFLIFCLTIMIALVTTKLHKKSKNINPHSQWLNLTGFPPVYLGYSTVISPFLIKQNSACVIPATLWSCDLPKELQSSFRGRPSKQPNLFIQIDWDNKTSANSKFSHSLKKRMMIPGARERVMFTRNYPGIPHISTRQATSFVPNPLPPSLAEGSFLGRTTDGIVSTEKSGEPTPFYASLLQSSKASVSKLRVDEIVNNFPNFSLIIPPPSVEPDGTMAPANLLPFPLYQPIRLFDRGLPTEHYGFYNYFDRSIFLKSIDFNDSDQEIGLSIDDLNGGATRDVASFRCTWSQTRFLIQIWTRKSESVRLNHIITDVTDSPLEAYLQQPGTFPYPLTITIDRHGGDPLTKILYCYAIDDIGRPIEDSGEINLEDRGFGGELINSAPNIFKNNSDPNMGGFDGGNSGCLCQWSNFEETLSLDESKTG